MTEKNKSLADELTEIFQSLPSRLEPDAKNEFQHYSYNSIQQIKEVVGKELKKHGILFIPDIDNVDNLNMGDKVLTTVHFIFKFKKNGQVEPVSSYGQAVDNQGKGLSKAKSDAIKRLFTDTFLIATSDEDDEKSYGKPASDKSVTPKATEKQIKLINVLIGKLIPNRQDAEQYVKDLKNTYGVAHLHDLTIAQASKMIEQLQSMLQEEK